MKDTYYFSHDYNSRTDNKIKRLISKHGLVGYGLFWAIIEDLYNNANALPTDYESIAFDLRTDEVLVSSVIKDFDLFIIDNGMFGSSSIERRLNERNEKSKKAKESANLRWQKHKEQCERNANALPTQSDSNAIKERKGKEIKESIKKEEDTQQLLSFLISEKQLELGAMACKTTLAAFTEYATGKAAFLIATTDGKYSKQALSRIIVQDFEKVRNEFELKTKPKTDADSW